jgi:hypothetical protein
MFLFNYYMFRPEGPSSGVKTNIKFKTTASQFGAILYTFGKIQVLDVNILKLR